MAKRLLRDAVLKLVITKGEAVLNVTSLTRGPTQAMRYAALWRSPTCTVEGCTRTIIEYDHRWGAEYKDTKHTRFDELDAVCHTHHDLHTHYGWALVEGTAKRPMVPPEDPRHPARAAPGGAGGRAGRRPSPMPRAGTDELRTAVDEALMSRARAVHERIRRGAADLAALSDQRQAAPAG